MVGPIELSPRRDDLGHDVVAHSYGGVTIYAPTDTALSRDTARIGAAILEITRRSLCTARSGIISAAIASVGAVDERVVAALIGRHLRVGDLDARPCEAQSGKWYSVIVHADMIAPFDEYVSALGRAVADRRSPVLIRDVRAVAGITGPAPEWAVLASIAARAVLIGSAEYSGRDSIGAPS